MQAKELIKNDKKSKALLLLKLKKYKEKEAEKIDDQLLTVVKMIEDIEWETIQVQAFEALEIGTQALKNIHSTMTPERVRIILEESEDAQEVSRLLIFDFYVSYIHLYIM